MDVLPVNELLVNNGSVSIDHQNLQKLAVEMFKVYRGLSPEVIHDLFQFRGQIPYKLRQRTQFEIPWFLVVQKAINFLAEGIDTSD